MAEEEVRCSLWERTWTRTMPNWVIRKVLDKKIVSKECLDPDIKKALGLE